MPHGFLGKEGWAESALSKMLSMKNGLCKYVTFLLCYQVHLYPRDHQEQKACVRHCLEPHVSLIDRERQTLKLLFYEHHVHQEKRFLHNLMTDVTWCALLSMQFSKCVWLMSIRSSGMCLITDQAAIKAFSTGRSTYLLLDEMWTILVLPATCMRSAGKNFPILVRIPTWILYICCAINWS